MADIYIIIIFILAALILFLTYLLMNANRKINLLSSGQEGLKHDIRSMNVKHGQHWEHFVPFMPDFEKIANKDNSIFVGKPVDFIAFDDDAVKFIEVKTGKSKLNPNQERVKKLIESGKVKWHELRYDKK